MADDWHLAPSLVALRTEINRRWPNRDKASDGALGDPSHQARKSDHNPDWDAGGVVRAIDVDKDGIIVQELLDAVVRDHRAAYVIWNRRIASATLDGRPWDWEPYPGDNPHTGHIHISIKHTRAAESDTSRWFLSRPDPDPEGDWFDMANPKEIEDAMYRGTLRALREYGASLFKDEQGTADALWDEARAHRQAELTALGKIEAAVKAQP